MNNNNLVIFSSTQLLKIMAVILISFSFGTVNITPAKTASPGWNNGKIKWMSFSRGMIEAQKTGKPAIVIFEAKWCQICKQYKKQFYKKNIVAASKKLIMIMVNIEKNRGLQKQYSPDGGYIPRTMAFSSKGYHNSNLTSTHPEFMYFIEPKSHHELLSFMKRAAAQ